MDSHFVKELWVLYRHNQAPYAASAEQDCTHPLARAILKAAHYARVVVHGAENAINEIGLSVRASVEGSLVEVGSFSTANPAMALPQELQNYLEDSKLRGETPLVVYRDHKPVVLLNVSDQTRPIASRAVDQFNAIGIHHQAILSGDHEQAVKRVAERVGISTVFSRLKPDDKVKIIKEYQSNHRPVMFVGNGINHAPALASAYVGVAMGAAGTDVALETADIALTHDDITKLPWLVRLSQRMLKNIKLNIVFGLLFNAVAVVVSGMGLLKPIMAAIVHNVGSVLVVIASASLAIFPDTN